MAPPIKCDCGTCQRCKHRVYMQAYYWRNREKTCETARRSRLRRIDAVRQFDRDRGYRTYDKTKKAARLAVTHAIEDGILIRKPCEVCGAKAQAHHADYSRPLEVRWLCTFHHGLEHRRPLAKVIA